ncbi:hypothetical protein K9M50_00770 [Patescibacteria group bacterium]|nr:hypothetical protein [Patescibacteria group bacterium]
MKRYFLEKDKFLIIIALFLYVIMASLLVYLLEPPYYLSICIVLAVPALFNFFLLKKGKIKILIFSLVTTFLFAPPIELMARLADAWDVASIFTRPFGLIPLENMLFAFLNFFWILSFYEFFLDTQKEKIDLSKRFKILSLLCLFLSIIVYGLFFFNSEIIKIDYHVIALIFLLPILIILGFKTPKLFKKTLIPTVFFAFVFFVYEIVSLLIGHWWWPGNYLLPISISGIIFPIDDVIIWYLLSTPALILGYEFFADDNK